MVDGRIDALDSPHQLKQKFKQIQWMKCFISWREARKEENDFYYRMERRLSGLSDFCDPSA
jgi:hypothetical protein